MVPLRLVSSYFVLQGFAIAAWWAMLWFDPRSIGWFFPKAWNSHSFLSFWLADIVLLSLGSLLVAFGVYQKQLWASTAAWSLAVTSWYPTLYCLAVSFKTGEAWVASAMMTVMGGGGVAMASMISHGGQDPNAFRVTSMKGAILWWSTAGQIVLFWGTFLVVIPLGVVEVQGGLGVPCFSHPWQLPASTSLLTLASGLGLWSAISMVKSGGGTPLPMAQAPRLVISGPYRLIRNPMAVAGILQAVSVGWLLGSVPVIGYALMGIIIWNRFVRPTEEADLFRRFGQSYEEYRSRVRLWIPCGK